MHFLKKKNVGYLAMRRVDINPAIIPAAEYINPITPILILN